MKTDYDFIEPLIADVLSAPGNQKLSSAEKEALTEQLRTHADDLILETFTNRLDAERAKELRQYVGNPEVLEEKIAEYSAQIPGLAEDIEARLKREFEMLKALA